MTTEEIDKLSLRMTRHISAECKDIAEYVCTNPPEGHEITAIFSVKCDKLGYANGKIKRLYMIDGKPYSGTDNFREALKNI